MSNIAVRDLITKIEMVDESLLNEALLAEQQFNVQQAKFNKKTDSSHRGLRVPAVKNTDKSLILDWYKKKISNGGQFQKQHYKCPLSGQYSISRIAAGSPEWERDLIQLTEIKFTELRALSKKIKSLKKQLIALSETVQNDLTFECVTAEPDVNAELGVFTLSVINDLFDQTDEILDSLFNKAVFLQDQHYEEWMVKVNEENRAVAGRFPTIRMNSNTIEIRWIKRVNTRNSNTILTTFKKGKNAGYNTHNITIDLPAWAKDLVTQTEKELTKIRESSGLLHRIRRAMREINEAINNSSMVDSY